MFKQLCVTIIGLNTWTVSVSYAYSTGCTLNTDKDIVHSNDPVLFTENNLGKIEFILPYYDEYSKEGYISLAKEKKLILACTGKENYLNKTKEKLNYGICLRDDQFLMDQKQFSSKEFYCKHHPAATIIKTNKFCNSNKGIILEISFDLDQIGFHKLIELCHNVDLSATYYAKHRLYGQSLQARIHATAMNSHFKRGPNYLYKGFNPRNVYSVDNQEDVFTEIFGFNTMLNFINKNQTKFISKGHLAPVGDFIYPSWMANTYFFINTAPQWQSINGGEWVHVENTVRKLAKTLKRELEIYTGVTGILKLDDKNGVAQEIYLADNRLPVPKYFWKIILNPQDSSCMGIICTNNPYLNVLPKPLCTNICNQYGWPVKNNQLYKGHASCCAYQEMKIKISEIPTIRCNKILRFPTRTV